MPPSSRISFFFRERGAKTINGVPEIKLWLDRQFQVTPMDPHSESSRRAREEVEEICRMVISDTEAWKVKDKAVKDPAEALQYAIYGRYSAPFPSAVLQRVLKAAVELDKIALFKAALKACSEEVPVSLYRDLGVMLGRYKYELRDE